jgi:hypothetical protein
MPQRGTFSGQIEGVDPALPLLPVVVCAVSLTSSERGGCHRSLRHLLILSEGIMEANDGKKVRRLKKSTTRGDVGGSLWRLPCLPSRWLQWRDASDDDSKADSNSGQGEFHEFQNPLLSASLVGFDIDCACANRVSDQQFWELNQVNGIGPSREQLRSSNPEVEDDLKERFWSSGGSRK